MEQKYDETSEKQPDDSPSKQGNKQESGDGASEKQSAESRPESESNVEAEKSEQDTETPTTSSDKRKLEEVKEQTYETFSAVSAFEEYPLSPKKRIKCTDRQVVAGRIGPREKQLKVEESVSRTSAGFLMQGSPKHSPKVPGTSEADVPVQGSPKHSPKVPGTSEADVPVQGSAKHSPKVPGTSEAGVLRPESPRRLAEIHVSSITPLQHQQLENFSSSYSRSQDSPCPETPPSGSGVIRNPPVRSTIHSPMHSPIPSPIPSPVPSPMHSPVPSPMHSPMHSPVSTIPETSAAGAVMEGSRRYSPPIPGTSVSCDVIQGSSNRPPIKRTCTEEHQSYNADLVEKRFKEESGYQSDSALDLRKDFKKQMPSSTQPAELDRLRTSSDKMGEKPPEEKYATQSNFPRDPRSSSSETPGDGREANVSSTSNESVQTTFGEVTSSTQGQQVQNEADKSKTSPRASHRNFGARPKESKGRSRSEERIRISFPRDSPAKLHYGGPIISRINPQPEDPSESSGFRVPLPPEDTPPTREKAVENMLDLFEYVVERVFENVTERHIREQQRKEEEIKAKKSKENLEKFTKNWLLAKETTLKLNEKGRLKGGEKSTIAKDSAVAGPSTSGTGMSVVADPGTTRGGTTGRSSEENVEIAAPVEKYTSPKGKSTGKYKSKKSIPVRENIPLADQGICDENANVTGEPPRSDCEDDNANQSEACTGPTNLEGAKGNEEQNTSDVAAQRPQETPRNQGHLSLQHLLPHMDEISLNDSLENIVIPDSDQEDDNVDLQKYS